MGTLGPAGALGSARASWDEQGLLLPCLCAQHWQFVFCEGEAAAVPLGLHENKSPFTPVMSPQGMEQGPRHCVEPEWGTAPGPPA